MSAEYNEVLKHTVLVFWRYGYLGEDENTYG